MAKEDWEKITRQEVQGQLPRDEGDEDFTTNTSEDSVDDYNNRIAQISAQQHSHAYINQSGIDHQACDSALIQNFPNQVVAQQRAETAISRRVVQSSACRSSTFPLLWKAVYAAGVAVLSFGVTYLRGSSHVGEVAQENPLPTGFLLNALRDATVKRQSLEKALVHQQQHAVSSDQLARLKVELCYQTFGSSAELAQTNCGQLQRDRATEQKRQAGRIRELATELKQAQKQCVQAYEEYGTAQYNNHSSVSVANSRRYRDLLLFQFGALNGLMSMREVTSDMSTAKQITGNLRAVLEGWAGDLVRFVGDQSNLPKKHAMQLVTFNRNCYAASKMVRELEEALLQSLGDVEMALERLHDFWQDVQHAYVSEDMIEPAQVHENHDSLAKVAVGGMRRRLERLERSFRRTQDSFRGVIQKLSSLQDDFHDSTVGLAWDKAWYSERARDALANEAAAWFEWTAEPHRREKKAALGKADSLDQTLGQVLHYQNGLSRLVDRLGSSQLGFRRMVDFADDMRTDLAELELVATVAAPEVLDLSTKDLARRVLARLQEVSSSSSGTQGGLHVGSPDPAALPGR